MSITSSDNDFAYPFHMRLDHVRKKGLVTSFALAESKEYMSLVDDLTF